MAHENLTLRARCIIVSGNQFLLIKQSVSNKDRLIFPGGGVHFGESLLEGVKREVEEEINIIIPSNLTPQLKAIRETTVTGYYRCIEFFFIVDFGNDYVFKNIKVNHHENIEVANFYTIDELSKLDPKPEFWKEMILSNSVLFFNSDLTLEEYAKMYNDVPLCNERSEMVHVMLKPDTLFAKNQDQIISDLVVAGGTLVFRKEMMLNYDQVGIIYSDFYFESARKIVFDYLTMNNTEQLVFTGKPGLHEVFNKLKGKTGGDTGLRSKYVKSYTKLDKRSFQEWLSGNHFEQDKISLEMFCCNALHVASNIFSSNNGIKSILL
jgi:8-oxo-dGTP pyrophosphatase MutT (NUDIX family)